MAYDYVQIINDVDWKLVGIIPKNTKNLPEKTFVLNETQNKSIIHAIPKPAEAIVVNIQPNPKNIITPLITQDPEVFNLTGLRHDSLLLGFGK